MQYPDVRIRITNQSTPQAIESLQSGAVDLAVVTMPLELKQPLRATELAAFQDIPVAGPGFAQLADRDLTLAELAAYPLITLGRNTQTRSFYDSLFARASVALKPDIEVATSDQILPMVKHDLGIGFLPRSFAEEALSSGEVLELSLAEPLPKRSVCLIRDPSALSSTAALALTRMLTSEHT